MNDFKFDFDDILIYPKIKTHINSRYKDIKLHKNLPLFTAPMDTVVDLKNMKTFISNKINITLPRTISYNDFLKTGFNKNVFISFGFNELDYYLKNNLKEIHENTSILIDVANGHMQRIVDYCREIKRLRPDIKLMVGNIGNPDSYIWYAKHQCVDYIRVGIGNGGGCLTTKNSGVGYPMASLINETFLNKQNLLNASPNMKLPAIIADGGMKDYSDIIKALALGADYVMVGSIFNKTLESCASNYLYGFKINNKLAKYLFNHNYPVKKYFRGMSTKQAQKAMGKTTFKTSEGVVRYRKVQYLLSGWVENFEHYLRNAMSYSNIKTLDSFIGNTNICKITEHSFNRFNK